MKRTTFPKSTGVRALAKKIGVSPKLVSRKRQEGKSDALISDEARRRKARLAVVSCDATEIEQSEQYFGDDNRNGESKIRAETRKEIALANLREIEVRKESGELVEADAVRVEWGRHISSTKNSLLLLPSKLAPKLAVTTGVLQCQQILDNAIRSVLTELSEYRSSANAA